MLATPGFSAERALDRLGLFLLSLAVLFQGVFCWTEIGLGAFSVHDGTFHHALALRLIEAVRAGENPLDCWVSFSSMGYPVWRSYQPLVHWATATAIALGAPFASSGAVFGFLTWLMLCLHPPAYFVASRMLGVGRFGAGVAALVCLAPVALGNLNAFGVGYGSYVWSGSGLSTQLWAVPLLVLAIAATPGALVQGRGRTRAALLIGLTALCHLIFGFAAALSAVALTFLLPPREEPDAGPRRLARLLAVGAGTLSLCAFVVVPALLDGPFVNHSTWEPAWKWTSHGGPTLVRALLDGDLLDAGRWPILSVLLGASALAACSRWREGPARALLGLTALWLLLAFGRQTWGALLPHALFNEHIHMHRFVAVFQACAVLLIGVGVDIGGRWIADRPRWAMAAATALVIGLTPVLRERADALRATAALGAEHRLAVQGEQAELTAIFDLLDAELERAPGRTFAGLAGRWGADFHVGSAPAFHAVGLRGLDATSHLWHSMSLPSDALLAMDDTSIDHLRRFGVRYVLSDMDRTPAPGLTDVGRAGRFRLWSVPEGGYFGIQSAAWACEPDSDPVARLACARRWLAEPAPESVGQVLSERRQGAEHGALVELQADGVLVFRSSYHPAWTASVDGVPSEIRSVVPGFMALDLPAGRHDVRLRYRPGPLKPLLLALGLLGFLGLRRAERWEALDRFDRRLGRRLNAPWMLIRTWLSLPDVRPLLTVGAITVLATAPFFRGDLVLGHDATEYPTRLAELHQSWQHGVLLPVWAPDLGAGFGQPFFGFAAPVALMIAELVHVAGFGLGASLNGAVILLALLGAFGSYGLGRRVSGPAGGIVAAAAFVFSGYFQLELYVRGAAMEFSGLALLPLALVLLLRCLERPGAGRFAAASAGIAAVALSHNAVLLMAAPALALFVVLIASARRDLRTLGRGAAAGVGGLALSAWFWLPTLAEKRFTHVHRLLEGHTRWEGNFVDARQLWASEWGYGVSGPGPDDGMSFAIGAPLLVLAMIGLVAAVSRRRADPVPRAMVAAAVAVTALAVCMTHWVSEPAWAALELLQYLQFPWRFLTLVSVFLPLAAAATVPLWATLDRRLPTSGLRWSVLGPALTVATLTMAGVLHLAPSNHSALDDDEFAPAAIARAGKTTTTFREFEPIWVDAEPRYQSDRLEVVSGVAELRTVHRTPTRQRFEVDADGPARLQLATFWFPGWQVQVNGLTAELTWVDSGGLPRFDVPAGHSVVEARFRLTPIRRVSRLLSLLALLAMAGWLAMERQTKAEVPVDDGPTGGGTAELIVAGLIAVAALLLIFVSDERLTPTAADGDTESADQLRLATVQVELGLVALNKGRAAEAATAFAQATLLAPDSHAAWLDLGIAHSRLGQHPLALNAYVRALELLPESLDARHNLGVTWRELGDPARALQYLEPVLGKDPRRAGSWYELGLAHEALGQTAPALAAYSRAMQVDPGHEAARGRYEALLPAVEEPGSIPAPAAAP